MPNIQYNPQLTKTIREQLHLTQRDLSDLLDVAPYTIQRWEYGTSQPRANHLGIIHDIAAQNDIGYLPMFKKDDKVVLFELKQNYQGEYTLPIEIRPGRIIGKIA